MSSASTIKTVDQKTALPKPKPHIAAFAALLSDLARAYGVRLPDSFRGRFGEAEESQPDRS